MQDLNNHLFSQLERLNDEDITTEQMAQEIEKAKAIAYVARVISSNAQLELEAQKLLSDGQIHQKPAILLGAKKLGVSNGKV